MAKIIPIKGDVFSDEAGGAQFKAVDDNGRTLAIGNLEVEIIAGAQRHSSLQFVVNEDNVTADPTRDAIEQQARLGS